MIPRIPRLLTDIAQSNGQGVSGRDMYEFDSLWVEEDGMVYAATNTIAARWRFDAADRIISELRQAATRSDDDELGPRAFFDTKLWRTKFDGHGFTIELPDPRSHLVAVQCDLCNGDGYGSFQICPDCVDGYTSDAHALPCPTCETHANIPGVFPQQCPSCVGTGRTPLCGHVAWWLSASPDPAVEHPVATVAERFVHFVDPVRSEGWVLRFFAHESCVADGVATPRTYAGPGASANLRNTIHVVAELEGSHPIHVLVAGVGMYEENRPEVLQKGLHLALSGEVIRRTFTGDAMSPAEVLRRRAHRFGI